MTLNSWILAFLALGQLSLQMPGSQGQELDPCMFDFLLDGVLPGCLGEVLNDGW